MWDPEQQSREAQQVPRRFSWSTSQEVTHFRPPPEEGRAFDYHHYPREGGSNAHPHEHDHGMSVDSTPVVFAIPSVPRSGFPANHPSALSPYPQHYDPHYPPTHSHAHYPTPPPHYSLPRSIPTSYHPYDRTSATPPIVAEAKPKRKRISPEQLVELSALFAKTDTPSFDVRETTGARLGMSSREVQVWFQNRRAKMSRLKSAVTAGPSSSSSLEAKVTRDHPTHHNRYPPNIEHLQRRDAISGSVPIPNLSRPGPYHAQPTSADYSSQTPYHRSSSSSPHQRNRPYPYNHLNVQPHPHYTYTPQFVSQAGPQRNNFPSHRPSASLPNQQTNPSRFGSPQISRSFPLPPVSSFGSHPGRFPHASHPNQLSVSINSGPEESEQRAYLPRPNYLHPSYSPASSISSSVFSPRSTATSPNFTSSPLSSLASPMETFHLSLHSPQSGQSPGKSHSPSSLCCPPIEREHASLASALVGLAPILPEISNERTSSSISNRGHVKSHSEGGGTLERIRLPSIRQLVEGMDEFEAAKTRIGRPLSAPSSPGRLPTTSPGMRSIPPHDSGISPHFFYSTESGSQREINRISTVREECVEEENSPRPLTGLGMLPMIGEGERRRRASGKIPALGEIQREKLYDVAMKND